jgi:hypothetical protein
MFSIQLTRLIAIAAAAIVVAVGAYAIINATSGNGSSGTANAALFARSGGRIQGGSAPNQRSVGQIPQGWQPGSGTIITGAVADKAKAVALAKNPGGTVNRVLQLSDDSYAVHMIKISWPHHVFVDTSFQVRGAIG